MTGVESNAEAEPADTASADDGVPTGRTRSSPRSRWRKKRWMVPFAVLVLLTVTILALWLARERIAGDVIEDQLAAFDLPATYEIESIGPEAAVLTDLVVGDPRAPDFTAERVVVRLEQRLGTPEIGRVILTRPRLYGVLRGGRVSFGSLDEVIYRESDAPPGLPEIDIAIRDGRGLIETRYGAIGLKLDGEGRIDDGFSGTIAASAPDINADGCAIAGATLYGALATKDGAPSFEGPLRFRSLDCGDVSLAAGSAQLEARSDAALADLSGTAGLRLGRASAGAYAANGIGGRVRASLRGDVLAVEHTLALRGAASPYATAALVTLDGALRSDRSLDRLDWRGDVESNGLRLGARSDAAIAELGSSGAGTLVAPIAKRVADILRRESRGSAFAADLSARYGPTGATLVMPRGALRGGSGTRLMSLSRVEAQFRDGAPPLLAGNIAMGGAGLPFVNGRMERRATGDTEFRLAMRRYEAGGSALEIPRLTLAQANSGALRFTGEAIASGPLPGGSTRNLRLPIEGRWMPGGALAMWPGCTDVGFDSLTLANLTLERRRLTLCPPPGSAIVRNGPDGLRIAAGAPSLDLAGRLGSTPIRLVSGPVGFAYPGVITARELDVSLGPVGTAARFVVSGLDARFGEDIAGTFSDADVTLDAVPLDIGEATGNWRYRDGRLELAEGSFILTDRADPDRFEPLVARDATLALEDNLITAYAELRNPASDRIVTGADIRHDLSTGRGHADLAIEGLRFDPLLQPDDLSRLALGVVANARGIVSGAGRVDWGANGVTSSGQLTTDALDFAAAFGPVKGASGTIRFTDLFSLTTAPGQKLRVASINPGIEVLDGEVEFALRDWQFLSVEGGRWPFMGGELILREVDLNFGVEEERRYVFEIVGLDAGAFIDQMDIGNLGATGTFDGTIPIVFDAQGNGRIEGGLLLSRAPGGNLSYVGELTYEDLSPIANFAFDALRSLDFRQMRLAMDGPLTGEIVTRVRFDGVSQGQGALSNFITRRLAALPLQFRVNIRAPFYQLITSLKSLYDPAAVRDPRELGLLSSDGTRLLRREVSGEEVEERIEEDDIVPQGPGTRP